MAMSLGSHGQHRGSNLDHKTGAHRKQRLLQTPTGPNQFGDQCPGTGAHLAADISGKGPAGCHAEQQGKNFLEHSSHFTLHFGPTHHFMTF